MSRSYNDKQNANNPLWDHRTNGYVHTLTIGGGTADKIAPTTELGNPTYVIISNVGANNVWVSTAEAGAAGQGILVQPGATFETAMGENPSLFVFGTVGQTVYILTYS